MTNPENQSPAQKSVTEEQGVTLTAKQVLLIRDALVRNDINEAYHQLYAVILFKSFHPWAEIEAIAAAQDVADTALAIPTPKEESK